MTANELKSDQNPSHHYALQVALQTMKERCQSLQQRLTMVEDDNAKLRMGSGITTHTEPPIISPSTSGDQSEVELLRDKVAELSRQKVQLTEHIAMVATENRQLWSRLSKLTKDSQHSSNKLRECADSSSSGTLATNNLIRSKTFTQNSPNPMLRHKISPNECDDGVDESSEIENNAIGFGYLQDQNPDGEESAQNIQKIQDSLQEFKKQVLCQQLELRLIFSNIQNRKDLYQESSKKKLMETSFSEEQSVPVEKIDKCLETDPIPERNYNKLACFNVQPMDIRESRQLSVCQGLEVNTKLIDLMSQKYALENSERMCPMCGKLFKATTTFSEFQEHVESHFIDDSDTDYNSIDRNFEIVSHTVGDF